MSSTRYLAGCLLVVAFAVVPVVAQSETREIRTEFDGRIDNIERQGKELSSGTEVVHLKSPLHDLMIEDKKSEIEFHKQALKDLNQGFSSTMKNKNKTQKLFSLEMIMSNKISDEKEKYLYKERAKQFVNMVNLVVDSYTIQMAIKKKRINNIGASIQALRRMLSLKCPFRCRVEKVLVQKGDWVAAGTVLMTVSRQY